MKKEDRLCVFCERLNIEHSSMGSEWTGRYGEDGFACSAGHFSEYDEGCVSDLKEMRSLFKRAASCDDYQQDLDTGN